MSTLLDILRMADKLLNEENYLPAIKEYGGALELIFKTLYRQHFPELPYSDKERAINYERKLGKSIDNFTMGEWIGLFREAHIFDFIKNSRNIDEPLFLSFGLIDVLNKLRNLVTHPDEKKRKLLERYNLRLVALFMKSGVECLLYELGIIPAQRFIQVQPTGRTSVRGIFSQVSKEDILNAAKDLRIANYRWVSKYVEIEGKRYSVKGLLSIASGIPTSEFTTDQAEKVLEKLGFKVYTIDDHKGEF